MSTPFLSVVIPTRERADTLHFALKSCVTQGYADAEFIVCNNASTDNTEAVVKRFDDPRIRLINPGKRLSMRENWEFALRHVLGKYVTFIGDDDAIMPGGLEKLSKILAGNDVDAVKWQAPTYIWPQTDNPQAGRIALKFGNRIASVKSSAALNALRWGYLYYHFLPMIYHGALSSRLISDIKARTGDFFCCENPDVYSGIVAALTTEKYLYLQTPLTISGASRHSNGTCAISSTKVRTGSPTSLFFAECNLSAHPDFLNLSETSSSIHACVTDALLRARDNLTDGKFYVPLWYRLFLIVREISAKPGADLKSPTHPMRTYSSKRRMEWLYDFYLSLFGAPHRPVPDERAGSGNRSVLSIDTAQFGVGDVFGASIFLGNLLNCVYAAPADMEVRTSLLLFGRLLAKLSRFDAFQLFKLETLS